MPKPDGLKEHLISHLESWYTYPACSGAIFIALLFKPDLFGNDLTVGEIIFTSIFAPGILAVFGVCAYILFLPLQEWFQTVVKNPSVFFGTLLFFFFLVGPGLLASILSGWYPDYSGLLYTTAFLCYAGLFFGYIYHEGGWKGLAFLIAVLAYTLHIAAIA